jgi:MFS transporter, MCT family, solute carrier family 16 (monocarboxylic acid transporters), member 14
LLLEPDAVTTTTGVRHLGSCLIDFWFVRLERRSQMEVQNYVRSVTTIPEAVQPEAESWLWRVLPLSKAVKDTLKRMTDLSLVKDPLFLVPALANLLASVGLFVPFVYITKRATDLGVDASDAAWLLSTIGTSSPVAAVVKFGRFRLR